MEMTFEQIMEVEDSLQEAGVFVNGISGEPAHSDSYMTIVDFGELEKWLAKGLFSRKQLEYCSKYWSTNPNMQPPLRLLAFSISRYLGV